VAVKEKDTVPVDGVIAIIGDKEEKIDDLLKEVKSEPAKSAKDDGEKVPRKEKKPAEKGEKAAGEM
jgi:pyruvate dehydrogenase E2 component (dihydrolipoamide acetyltransferase)